MSKQMSKLRKSASLILLAKDTGSINQTFDYNVLLLTRHSKSSFMPESSVFPGGVCEAADSSLSWLTHFQRYDISASKLRELCPASLNPSEEIINAAISLRLTALRETFEEVGILLCLDRKTCTSTDNYAQFYEQFDRKHWQHVVHNDATKFLTLCEELDVLPDLWALHEWSIWRTPSTFKKRFDTTFFVTALKKEANVLAEPSEVKDYAWRSPLDYLRDGINKQLWLPPPQFYELSRFLNFKLLEELHMFAQKRAIKECVTLHPVNYKCTNGTVHLLTGDDMYPCDPDTSTSFIDTGLSIDAFRKLAKKNVHRAEQLNQHAGEWIINFTPADGQVNPLNPQMFIEKCKF